MRVKSLLKQFMSLKLNEQHYLACLEVEKFLKKNGFEITTEQQTYSKHTGMKRGIIYDRVNIATQVKTGKRIAFFIDKYNPQQSSIKMLKRTNADYKIIFVRNDTQQKPFSGFSVRDIDIEIIQLPTK